MADVNLVIDIAQKLTGQETTAQLEKLTSVLRGTSRETETLERAQIQAQTALDGATAETARLQTELNAASAEFEELKRASLAASAAAQEAVAANAGNADELVSTAMRAQTAVGQYAVGLRALRGRAQSASRAQDEFAKQAEKVAKVTEHVSRSNEVLASKLSRVQGALGDVGGPFGRFAESLVRPVRGLVEMRSVLGVAGTAAVGAIAAFAALSAAVAVTTAVLTGLVAVTAAVAIKLADVRRSTDLAAQAFDSMNPAVAAVRGEFAAITQQTGVSASRLQELASSLRDAKVSAEQLPGALRAAALAEAALGAGGANKFIADIKSGELAVSEFTTTAQQKLGGIVQRQMLGLGAQAQTLKRNLAGLFGGLEVDDALVGVSKLVGLFDATTASGKAIKFLFDRFFQPLVDSVNTAATAIEAFALGVLIGLVGLYVKLKPVIRAIADFFGFDDPATEDTFKAITAAGEVAALVIAGIGAAFLVVAALLAGAVALVAAPFIAAGIAISDAVTVIKIAIASIGEAFTEVMAWISGLNFAELGASLMQGLAKGITDSVAAVVGAVTDAVNATVGAAKSLLGIASPSKVFAGIGVNTGEGFASGIEDETDHAQNAIANLTAPPMPEDTALASLPGSAGGSATATVEATRESGSASGPSLDLAGATFIFNGVEDAEQAEERFSEALTRLLEGDTASLGAA